MSITLKTLADVLHELGDIPLERIRPPLGSATESDVIKHLDGEDKHICELIDGVLVEKAMGSRESYLAMEIARHIGNYLEIHDLGLVSGPDGPFRIDEGRIRFPDVAFVPWDQFPSGKVPDDPINDAVPELAVEVLSESNTPTEMKKKLADYFRVGVRRVWVVDPDTQSAEVFRSPSKKKAVGSEGSLDGEKILPGFSLSLEKLFGALERKRAR